MSGPVLAVGAVVVHAGRILLVRRGHEPSRGSWSVPGGRVRPLETLHEAVVREVSEETGLAVVVDRLLGYAERFPEPRDPRGEPNGPEEPDEPDASHLVILDFAAVARDPRAAPVAGDDAAEVAWVDLEALGDLDLADGLRAFLEDHGVVERLRTFELTRPGAPGAGDAAESGDAPDRGDAADRK